MSDAPLQTFSCCFCGKEIAPEGDDPTYLSVGTRSELSKSWWCHFSCFNARLPDLPEPWTMYDIEQDRR